MVLERPTRHSYREAGSFERLHEAALAVADADTDDDLEYHRACCRLRAAALAYAAARRTTNEQSALDVVG